MDERRPMVDDMPAVETVVRQLVDQGIVVPPAPVHVDGYGNTPEMSRALLRLIRDGAKRAGTGLLWWHEERQIPWATPGNIEIVLTHEHRPSIVTRIVSVEIVPFNEVTAAYAAIEGEGDGSLAYWREAHWSYFAGLCRELGRAPSDTMPVVCSVFEVLHVLPDPGSDGPVAPC